MSKFGKYFGVEDFIAIIIGIFLLASSIVSISVNFTVFAIFVVMTISQFSYISLSVYRKSKINKMVEEKEKSIQYMLSNSNQNYNDIRQNILETEVYNILEKEFPDALLLKNLYVKRPNEQFTEIDILMLCVDGIFIIECKNYDGKIRGDWSQPYLTLFPHTGNKSYEIQNPIEQNSNHFQYLQKLLSVGVKGAIKNLVVVGNSTYYEREGVNKRKYGSVFHSSQLKYSVQESRKKSRNIVSSESIHAYYETLKVYANERDDLKQIHITNIKNNF